MAGYEVSFVVHLALLVQFFVFVQGDHIAEHNNPLFDLQERAIIPIEELRGGGRSDFPAIVVGTKVLLFGGCTQLEANTCTSATDSILEYDPRTGAFVELTAKLRAPRFRHAATNHDGRVYIAGGLGADGKVVSTVEVFDPNDNSVQLVQGVEVPFADGAAFSLGDSAYHCGGFAEASPVATADCIPISGGDANTFSMTSPRGYFQIAVLAEVAYAFGGFSNSNDSALDSIESFAVGGTGWETYASTKLQPPRGGKSVVAFHEELLFFGGDTASPSASIPNFDVNTITEFVPAESNLVRTMRVNEVAEMPSSMVRPGVASYQNYFIFIFGGQVPSTTEAGKTEVLASTYRFYEAENIYEHPITSLHGSGTTNPSRYFRKWMNIVESRAKVPLRLTYRAVGSSSGQKDFIVYPPVVDFSCGDIPLSKERYDVLATKGTHEVIQIPFALGTISVFHNVPELEGPLELKACELAQIYKGTITHWNQIGNLGDILQGQKKIIVGRRQLGSSSTFGLTDYMNKLCVSEWTWAGGADMTKNVGLSLAHHTTVQGSSKMTALIKDTPYAIGYVDSGHGIDSGLKEVAIEVEKNGKAVFHKSNDDDIQKDHAAKDPLAATDDWSAFELVKEFPAWPITMQSYFYVHRDQRGNGVRGSLLKAFIGFVLGLGDRDGEGQKDLESYGFIRLPQAQLTQVYGFLDRIKLPENPVVFEFEYNTLPEGQGMTDYMISSKRNPKPVDLEQSLGNMEAIAAEAAATAVQAATTERDQLQAIAMELQKELDQVRGVAFAALLFALLFPILIVSYIIATKGLRQVPFMKETEMKDTYATNGKNGGTYSQAQNVSQT